VNDITIEVSGNITKDNVAEYAKIADIISMGSLTHSVRSVHFSMNVR
jgi:nicotinate-nucleotide pyrophosphorylase (carboxylating)